MNKIYLRPFTDEDLLLFEIWLNKEYIKKWYLDPEDWLMEVHHRADTYSWIHHFIVMSNDIAIGFCQYYDCYDGINDEIEDWYSVSKPNHTFSIDYLIGNENYLRKGYGKEIIRLLTQKVKAEQIAEKIIVQPDIDNIPSNKALLANGYIFDSEKNYYIKELIVLKKCN